MKNYSRAYSRHIKKVKFLKRLKNWLASSENKIEETEQALNGDCLTFLRTTGRPCNCFMCSGGNKYNRTPKHRVIQEAMRE
jgi:hypothetical protein